MSAIEKIGLPHELMRFATADLIAELERRGEPVVRVLTEAEIQSMKREIATLDQSRNRPSVAAQRIWFRRLGFRLHDEDD